MLLVEQNVQMALAVSDYAYVMTRADRDRRRSQKGAPDGECAQSVSGHIGARVHYAFADRDFKEAVMQRKFTELRVVSAIFKVLRGYPGDRRVECLREPAVG